MRKIHLLIVYMLLIGLCLLGCGKKSAVEGKLADGKGAPLKNVKIVAKQELPIKGYEQFETTSTSDGSFKFKKLFPSSTYNLTVFIDDKAMSVPINIDSAPEGQTRILPETISIRFMVSKDGETVIDSLTGLMWVRDVNIANGLMEWDQAMKAPRRFEWVRV